MSMILGLLWLTTTIGAPAGHIEYALPVGLGTPGQGPWQVKLWTKDDCAACTVPQDDRRTFARVRDALVSADPDAVLPYNTPVTTVRFTSDQPRRPIDLVALRRQIGACKIGAQAPLHPNEAADPATSFGLGLDCPGNPKRQFVSLTVANGALKTAYFLPDQLISVLMKP